MAGVIDFSSWDFSASGPVRLFGEWEFQWDAQADPARLAKDGEKKDFFPVPSLWHGRTAEGRELAPMGSAVYRLRVRMPDNHPEQMAVLVAGGLSTCEIWINGSKMAASGTVGFDEQSEKPRDHYVIAECPESWRLMDIMLRVSNHHNVQGGLNGDVLLGLSPQINGFYGIPRLLGACMGGALFCLALLYVTLFYMRRSSRENLYFGLFCLFWCMAILFSPSSGFLMTVLVPAIPWDWYITWSILPYGVTIPFMLLFYHSLFPKKYGKIVERVYLGFGLVYMAYILATPPNAYDVVLLAYFSVSGLALVYMFACYSLDLVRGERGIAILMLGYLALGFAELDDMFFDLNIIDVASLRPLGVFIFILSYAFYLAFRFSSAFTRTETLSRELEQKNIRLLQLDRLKDEFLANTTHELKTPLAGMVGIAESLIAGAEGGMSEAAAAHLNVIAHSGKRLSNLINDVQDLSRLKHQDIALKLEVVSLYASAQRVLALAQAMMGGKNTLLINEIPVDFPKVMADPDRLEQVLFNLIGNSLKCTEGGHIAIAAASQGGRVEVAVTDTGCGIAPEDQERIFNAYEQGTSPGAGGTGLGLSISRYLVELHGGVLGVQSERGVGSRFFFTLPPAEGFVPDSVEQCVVSGTSSVPFSALHESSLRDNLSSVVSAESLSSSADTANGEYQVLVVDDEPVNLQVVASILNIEGISFRTAENGSTALRMIENGDRPDMVLLDVMMPDMSGYAVCRELRRQYPASVLPVVLLTVKNRVEDIVEGFSAGANDYLTKPFAREELGARVAIQLKLKEAYGVLEENLELKRELELRRKTESGLRFMQARLATILDSLDEAIVGVNLSNEIAFCNKPLQALVGRDSESLLGNPLTSILIDAGERQTAAFLEFMAGGFEGDGSPALFDKVPLVSEKEEIEASIWCNVVEIEEETLFLLSVYPEGIRDRDGGGALSSKLIRELSENRQRILSLEETMLSLDSKDLESQHHVLENVKAFDELLASLSSRLGSRADMQDKRSMAVHVVNLAVNCWTAATGTTKADMAEQSGLWNVYMERDGYFRTQTLDKYLDSELLPQKPRWQKVLVTADFVLANCLEDTPLRRELEAAATTLRAFF
ncbi:response regulator [Pseudodesulfovibrio sp. S3-i]|nr:response regulator [Pseudodesulfovibrio sp. S3-i]